jgi:hypothetical protein
MKRSPTPPLVITDSAFVGSVITNFCLSTRCRKHRKNTVFRAEKVSAGVFALTVSVVAVFIAINGTSPVSRLLIGNSEKISLFRFGFGKAVQGEIGGYFCLEVWRIK